MNTKTLFDLTNRIALITGGAGLLGVKHAEAIAEMGGIPILVDICKEGLTEANNKLSNFKIDTYCCDITQKNNLEHLLAWVVEKYKRLDILINNAAINPKVETIDGLENSRFEDYSLDTLKKEIDVGLIAAILCSQIFGKYMAQHGGGVILNISSDLGIIAPNQNLYKRDHLPEDLQPVKPVSYSVIKHSLIGLTRYIATYWADKGVRCNALAPGGVENGQNPEFIEKVSQLIPMNRMATPNEYKAAVVFLVSEASSYMTGSVLSVDGGRTCW